MEKHANYNSAWEQEEQNLATKSISKIWLLAAIIIPFFAFLEIQSGIQQVLGFLYLALPLSLVLLLSVAFHKKIKLPPAVLTYSVSVIIAILFSFMASKTRIQNVHNYILGVSMITLVRGVLYFGRAKNLMVVTLINHAIAFTMIVLIRPEAITTIPNVLSAYLFSIIFIIFSYVGMQTRYNLTKENFITSLKLKDSFEEIEEKNKDILDSIHYAERIQKALLASDALLKQNLPEHFVLFKPKDIVSGDFYWATKHNNRFYLAVCDSTGHGVPGAFMSLLNISYLNEGISGKNLAQPNEVFNHARKRLIDNISQDGQQDGMDGILVSMQNGTVEYAAAHNPPMVIRKGEAIELSADKIPVGRSPMENTSFTHNSFNAQKGDVLYLFTDGYADQFGGPKGKKFKYKQLQELLMVNCKLSMQEQKQILDETFNSWKGSLEQVDDILIIGIRV